MTSGDNVDDDDDDDDDDDNEDDDGDVIVMVMHMIKNLGFASKMVNWLQNKLDIKPLLSCSCT